MSFFTLIVLAAALGTDAFSLCVGIGLAGVSRRQIFWISSTVLVFHIIMPLTGWIAGELAGDLLGRAAALIGALILIFLGLKMLWDARNSRSTEIKVIKFNAWGIILLGASVSLDALSVGFTLGSRQVDLLQASGVIGIVAGSMAACGLIFGRFLGRWAGEKAQLLGGLVLIGIGIKLLF